MHVCMNVSMCGGAHMCVHMCVYVCVRAHLEMFVCIRSSVYGNIGETSKESLRLFFITLYMRFHKCVYLRARV